MSTSSGDYDKHFVLMADIDLNDPLDLNKKPTKKKPAETPKNTMSQSETIETDEVEKKSEAPQEPKPDPDPYNLKGREPIDR